VSALVAVAARNDQPGTDMGETDDRAGDMFTGTHPNLDASNPAWARIAVAATETFIVIVSPSWGHAGDGVRRASATVEPGHLNYLNHHPAAVGELVEMHDEIEGLRNWLCATSGGTVLLVPRRASLSSASRSPSTVVNDDWPRHRHHRYSSVGVTNHRPVRPVTQRMFHPPPRSPSPSLFASASHDSTFGWTPSNTSNSAVSSTSLPAHRTQLAHARPQQR
jgi:hypothetical protein